jgi:Tol biopolymer transport system component
LTEASVGTGIPCYYDWSHGGDPVNGISRVAFASQGVIFIAQVDLDAAEPLTGLSTVQRPGFSLDYPGWSPNDDALVFTSNDATRSQLVSHSFATGVQKVLVDEGSNRRKVFAPDWRRTP